MKLLFICGADIKGGALSCAGWIKSLIAGLDKDIEISLFCAGKDRQNQDMTVTENGRYVPVFFYTSSDMPDRFKHAVDKARPDAVVIFGTEAPYTRAGVDLCRESGLLGRTALFAQGICCACAQSYTLGLPPEIISRYTLRDILRRSNIRKEQKVLLNRAKDEEYSIKQTSNFIGRTSLDEAVLRMYNPSAEYYHCGDVLGGCFYDGEWRYNSCTKRRIFVTQYYYPIKGFHYLLDAAAMLKDKYPDLTVAAAGYNPIQTSVGKKEFKDSSYIRYIKELVQKYGLQDHIELTGMLSAEEMKREYLKSNVFVLPSVIENSPNSMAEAMMLGVPTVAADAGGVSDFAEHRSEAYIYPSTSAHLLAYYIDRVFSDPEGAERLGAAGRRRAKREYDKEHNLRVFESTVKEIANKSR